VVRSSTEPLVYHGWLDLNHEYMKATPWVAGANGPDSFFETGLSTSQNVEVSGGDDNTTYRFSYTYFDQNGVMPNSRLVKNNVMFNGSQKILDRLKITTSANYIKTEGKDVVYRYSDISCLHSQCTRPMWIWECKVHV